ncbi:MAG: efflux RND transporter periplasmic adaptor subunit, partial [Anaerolineales bacterium]|nr:efflux RND transporter periplasmic adaptor subunit [Anaerolineales bacterium]
YFWQQQQQAAAAQVELRQATVGRGAILSVVSATGPLAAEAQVNLSFSVSGLVPVARVNVSLGEAVQAGDVLAELDPADLQLAVTQAEQSLRNAELALAQLTAPPRAEDLAVAEANLRLAKAQVFQASQGTTQRQVEVARLNLVLAQQQLDQLNQRMDDLVEQGKFGDKQSLEGQQKQLIENARVAEQRYLQAKEPASPGRAGSALASVEQAEVALAKLKRGPSAEDRRIAEIQVEQAQAGLEQARRNLAEAQLRAPFAGVVAAVNIREGEPAAGALPAVVLVDTTLYHVDVAVDEIDIARIAAGQSVTVTVDALPNDVFSGVVDRIAPQASVTAGVVSYAVRVVVTGGDPRLRAGLTATAEIIVAEVRDVVLAPNWAIRRDRTTGAAFASVLRAGQVQEVPVTLGLRNETFSQVTEGLAAGDIVAIRVEREAVNLFGGP